jgi:hypothetical protein
MTEGKLPIDLSDPSLSVYSRFKVNLIFIFAVLIVLLGFIQTAEGFAPTTVYTVTNTNNSGPGSLRQAIIDANNHSGEDTISFNIPTSDLNYNSSKGWWVITPTGLLPSLTDDETSIDGGLQEVNQGNTNPTGLELVIDGSSLVGSMSILTIESDRNNISNLTIANAPGPGIRIITGADTNVITNNYIGTDPNGLISWGNESGIEITSGAHHNVVDMCTISGNSSDGILITGNGTNYNKVRRSFIGLDATGNAPLPNNGDGVWITSDAIYNEIGGQYHDDEGYRNWISANKMRGVHISGAITNNNYIGHNYIGITYSGSGSPDVGNLLSGVLVENGPNSNHVLYNTISGNHNHGIFITGDSTDNNRIIKNIIGANPQLTSVIPNHHHGVAVYDEADGTFVGETPDLGNVIVGNGWSGVAVKDSRDIEIKNNLIGLTPHEASSVMGNKFYGVHITGYAFSQISYNHIANNGIHAGESGVLVDGSMAIGTSISHNSIHDNFGKGIELKNGGNLGIPAPTINTASCTTVSGITCAYCAVEIYSDRDGEGEIYEGSLGANAPGQFSFTGLIHGPNVTAITWEGTGTSEFSLPILGACYNIYMPVTYKNY